MADEKPKDGEPNKTDEAKGSVSLTEASKSGFNTRAWNDPPPLLLNTAAVQAALQARDSPSRPKLAARVAYPINSPTPAPSMVLNPNAPPPTMGFINLPGSLPNKGAPPRNGGSPPPSSS